MRKLLTFLILVLPIFAFAQTDSPLPPGSPTAGTAAFYKSTVSGDTSVYGYFSGLNKSFQFVGRNYFNNHIGITTQAAITAAIAGSVPSTRTLTIAGTAYDLSTNRTWTLANLTNGVGITALSYNGSATSIVKADTTTLQTIANFTTKGNTYYYGKTASDARYAQLIGGNSFSGGDQVINVSGRGLRIGGNASLGGGMIWDSSVGTPSDSNFALSTYPGSTTLNSTGVTYLTINGVNGAQITNNGFSQLGYLEATNYPSGTAGTDRILVQKSTGGAFGSPIGSIPANSYLTPALAASTYQPLNTKLTAIAALANAAGVLTNNGSGVYSYTTPNAGTVTSITPGYGFTSSTPITSSGTMTIDSTSSIVSKTFFNGKIGTGVATALNGKQSTIAFGTGVQSALGINVGAAGSFVVNGGALGTPSSGVATNFTGTATALNIGGNAATATSATTAGTVTTAAQPAITSVGTLSGLTVTAPIAGSVTGSAANVTGIVLGANGGTGIANTGKTITLGGNFTTSGAFATTLTSTATTSVTLPTTGTLVTLLGVEALTNKDLTAGTNTFPTLNQNTTGSAARWTTGRTLSITGDLVYTSPSFDGSGNVTAAGTLASIITAGGPTGSATVVPIITYDIKGRLTTVSSATITPAIGSITGLGTGIATSLAINTGLAGAPVLFNGAGGTPSSMVGTNITGIPNVGLVNSTISGVSLGSTLAAHSVGYGLSGSNYTGAAIQTWTADTTSAGGLMSKARAAANFATITTVAGKAAINSATFIGTTSHTLNRSSASEALTGITFPTAPTATDMPVRWQDTTRFLTRYALAKMVMIGNSLTYGTGSTSTDSTMTANLGRLSNTYIYNYGVPGETSTQIRTRFFALSGAMKQLPIIIEAGRNNNTDSATVIADISAMANYLISIHNNKFLIDAIPNASGEPFGNSGYNIIIATNLRLAQLFPGHFVDSRQALLGYGNGSGTDNTDIANSVIPTSLRFDNIHLNDKGYRTKAGIYMAYMSVLLGESTYASGLSVSGSPKSGFQGAGINMFTLGGNNGYIQNFNSFYPAVSLPLPLHIQYVAGSSLYLNEAGGNTYLGDPGVDASTTTQVPTWNVSTGQFKRTARGQIASSGSSITVTNGAGTVIGANVNVDIASTYAGQTSITTLGTIATGVWNGTIIGSTKGGSGVNNAGTLSWGAGGTLGTNAYTSTTFNSGAGVNNYLAGYTGTNTQSNANGFQFDASGNLFTTASGTAGGFWLASNNSTYTNGFQFAGGNINLYSTNNVVNTNAVVRGLTPVGTTDFTTKAYVDAAGGTKTLVTSSAGTLTLARNTHYTFTGSTATYTLPTIASLPAGQSFTITVKNHGSGLLTVTSGAGSEISTTSSGANTSTSISALGFVTFTSDGSYWNTNL